MALTKIPRGLLDTGIADSSDATAITIDSSENVTFAGNILKTGDLTLDVSGDFIFDADGGDIRFLDGGTEWGRIQNGTGSQLILQSKISDEDMLFQGNDGGSNITALTLDMSDAGSAIFNADVNVDRYLKLRTTDDHANSWLLYTHTDDTLRINYNGAGNDEVVIDTSGGVQIGDSVGTGYGLTADIGTQYGAIIQTTESTPSANPAFWVKNDDDGSISTLLRVQNNGNVGIGNNDTVAKALHILKDTGVTHNGIRIDNTTSYYGQLEFFTTGGSRRNFVQSSGAAHLELGSDSSTNGEIHFYTNGAIRAKIAAAGTATFEHPIVVQSGATQGYYIENNAGNAVTPRITNDANDWTIIRPGVSGGDVAINNYANTANRVIFTDEGKVGIGRAPDVTLEVNGPLKITNNTVGGISQTHTNMTAANSGKLLINFASIGTMVSGDTIVFTYAATSWKSWFFKIRWSSTGGYMGELWAGGYNNNSDGYQILNPRYYAAGSGDGSSNSTVEAATLTVTRSGQANTMTLTLNGTHIHPLFEIEYACGGGEGYPNSSKATITVNS